MTLKQKLDEKLERLDNLEMVLDEWIEVYQSGSTFPENPKWSSNSHKLKVIRETVSEMIEVAEHAELLEELIEDVEKW